MEVRRLVAFGLLAAALAARADSTVTRELQVRQLAPGIYTIRHPDPTDDFPDGNTTVVIGARAVLVVDTCYLPSAARADIERIRTWTALPVRYVVNTHWHNDHVGGNLAYLQAFPGADVLAHPETRTMMEARLRSYMLRFVSPGSAFAAERERLRGIVERGVDGRGGAVDAAGRQAAQRSLQRYERAAAEFRAAEFQPPTLTFEQSLRIDLGGRIVELRHAGRGNTGGDIVAYLPAERILVAGDLVAHPVPYAFSGFPGEWIATLERLAELDVQTIVPGHGEVLQGSGYLRRVAALLRSVRDRVSALLGERGSALTLEEAQQAVDLAAARREWAGDDADDREFFDASMASLVRLIYNEARAR